MPHLPIANILAECKGFTWRSSIVAHYARKKTHFAQVVKVSVLELSLTLVLKQEEIATLKRVYKNLAQFLQVYSSNPKDNTPFCDWIHEVMTAGEYFADELRFNNLFPDLGQQLHIADHELLFVMYPNNGLFVRTDDIQNLYNDTKGHYYATLENADHGAEFKLYSTEELELQKSKDLSKEIETLYKSLLPDPTESYRKSQLANKIQVMLDSFWPNEELSVQMFGSAANGLDLNGSDLDLCIVVPKHLAPRTYQARGALEKQRGSYFNMRCLANHLRHFGMTNIVPILKANVPICKFYDPLLDIKCDINVHNVIGVDNTRLIKTYTELDDRVLPFLYAIKHFAKRRDINDNTKGTMSSYAYVILGLFYLTTRSPPVIPNLQQLDSETVCIVPRCSFHKNQLRQSTHKGKFITSRIDFHDCIRVVKGEQYQKQPPPTTVSTFWLCRNKESLGQLLTGFFSYFAREFRDRECFVSLRMGGIFYREQWKDAHIAIEDPFIESRNVAASCSKIGVKTIIKEFERAYDLLNAGENFQKVCGLPEVGSRAFDPHTIQNRKQHWHGAKFREYRKNKQDKSAAVQHTRTPNASTHTASTTSHTTSMAAAQLSSSTAPTPVVTKGQTTTTIIKNETNTKEISNKDPVKTKPDASDSNKPPAIHNISRQQSQSQRKNDSPMTEHPVASTKNHDSDRIPTADLAMKVLSVDDIVSEWTNTSSLRVIGSAHNTDESTTYQFYPTTTFVLRDIPNHIDELDIGDALFEYGVVMQQHREYPKSDFGYFYTSDHYVDVCIPSTAVLPEELELQGEHFALEFITA